MDLRELRSLTLIADNGSISRTALNLHLSPAAVHKQLKGLEAEIGVRIYEKVGGRLQLTQAGEVLLPYARDLLARFQGAVEAIEEWRGLRKGLVRIGTGPTVSTYLLPKVLRTYRKRYPDIDLTVVTGDTQKLLHDLERGGIDFAILVHSQANQDESNLTAAEWDFEIVVVSGTRRAPAQCPMAALKKSPFILFQKGSRVEDAIERYLAGLKFSPRVIMRFDNAEAIKAMVRAGLGISMLPFWTVEADLRRGVLYRIQQAEEALFAKIALVVRKDSYVPKAVEAFISLIRDCDFHNARLTARAERRTAGRSSDVEDRNGAAR